MTRKSGGGAAKNDGEPGRDRRARPGTAVQSKGRQRAGDILRAARAVLVEEGYAALTTRKIAERVGIRQSNVQYYYPAKADLVRALFEEAIADEMQAIARESAQTKMSPLRRMMWSIDQFLAQHHSLEHQRFLRELWALAAHDPSVAAVMNDFYRRWIDMAARNVLGTHPALGRRRAERRALLIICLVDGLSLFHGAAGVDHPALEGIERELRGAVQTLVAREELGD